MGNTVFLFEKSNKEILTESFYDREREDYSYQETLPYERLGGDGFERLCYLILLNENQRCIPHFFGRKGQADYGVDLTLHDEKGGFSVYQCKNWNRKEELSVKAFEDIFNDFNKRWIGEQGLPKPGRFILFTSMKIDKDTPTHKAFIDAKAAFEKRYVDQWGLSILVEYCDRTALDKGGIGARPIF